MDKEQIRKDMGLPEKKMTSGNESGSDNAEQDVHATDPARLSTSEPSKSLAEIDRRMKLLK